MQITRIKGREILDSRGTPTVEAEVTLSNGITARASVPSGASTGQNEAMELRDKEERYYGNGVLKAARNINKEIAPAIEGLSPFSQREIDRIIMEIDGTPNKNPYKPTERVIIESNKYGTEIIINDTPLFKRTELIYEYEA